MLNEKGIEDVSLTHILRRFSGETSHIPSRGSDTISKGGGGWGSVNIENGFVEETRTLKLKKEIVNFFFVFSSKRVSLLLVTGTRGGLRGVKWRGESRRAGCNSEPSIHRETWGNSATWEASLGTAKGMDC